VTETVSTCGVVPEVGVADNQLKLEYVETVKLAAVLVLEMTTTF
jgi:hypothetical protein